MVEMHFPGSLAMKGRRKEERMKERKKKKERKGAALKLCTLYTLKNCCGLQRAFVYVGYIANIYHIRN